MVGLYLARVEPCDGSSPAAFARSLKLDGCLPLGDNFPCGSGGYTLMGAPIAVLPDSMESVLDAAAKAMNGGYDWTQFGELVDPCVGGDGKVHYLFVVV